MSFMPATAYSYIRFSTPQQLMGDSLRRQLEASARYVSENGLVLDETLNLHDLGISAYRGKNVERGALGAFIKAIEAGRVKVGSYLIVESLDRLSRTEVIDALEPFLKIIRAGINIVTLVDDHVYSKDSIKANFTELIISISVMSRAHEESKVKSFRRKERWKNAKEQARETGKKITRKIPFWLPGATFSTDLVVHGSDGKPKVLVVGLIHTSDPVQPRGPTVQESARKRLFTEHDAAVVPPPLSCGRGNRGPQSLGPPLVCN